MAECSKNSIDIIIGLIWHLTRERQMQLAANQTYRHTDLQAILGVCPVCHQTDMISVWSQMPAGISHGKEGVNCERCHLNVSFNFEMTPTYEIIDAYNLDSFKIGPLEFINHNKQLSLFYHNIWVQDILNNIVDLDKCQQLLLIS